MTGGHSQDKLLDCPAHAAIRVIAGKWKTRILWLLRDGEMQFGELRRQLKPASAKMISDHLRQLERDGLIRRREQDHNGLITSHYAYTPYGETLIPLLDGLGAWGLAHTRRQD